MSHIKLAADGNSLIYNLIWSRCYGGLTILLNADGLRGGRNGRAGTCLQQLWRSMNKLYAEGGGADLRLWPDY